MVSNGTIYVVSSGVIDEFEIKLGKFVDGTRFEDISDHTSTDRVMIPYLASGQRLPKKLLPHP